MGRGPEAASMDMVTAALAAGGENVCTELVRQLSNQHKATVERAARTLKKVSEANPAALFPWRRPLLQQAFRATDVRVQWNLSIVLSRLPLRGRENALVIDLMFERLQDQSGLNRTFALQALANLSANDPTLRSRLQPIIEDFIANGTPAMRARARRLKSRE